MVVFLLCPKVGHNISFDLSQKITLKSIFYFDLIDTQGKMSEDGMLTEDVSEEEDGEDTTLEAITPEKRARHAITGRGVTLQMLMADGVIEPGEGLLTLEYLVRLLDAS